MKKGLLFIGLFLCVFCSLSTYGQGWEWGKTNLCNGGRGSELGIIAIDKFSNFPGVYAAGGSTADSLCLPGHKIYNNIDSIQLLIIKYDTSGNILWTINSDTNGQCVPTNLATDAWGNLFVLGILYTDSVSFGSHKIRNLNYIKGGGLAKNDCYFIMKIDPLGNILWSKCEGNIASKFELMVIGGITVDSASNIYVTGTFNDSVLNVQGNIFLNTKKDSGDIFLIKYDPSGNYIWGKTFGGIGNDYGERVLIGTNNRLYLSGWFTSSSLVFGATTLNHTGWMPPITTFRPDAFLVELDTSGNPLWAKCSIGNAEPCALALDKNNNIFLGGSILDTAFSFGTYSFSNRSLYWGAFLLKFDTSGNVLWGKSLYPLSNATSGLAISIYEMTVDPCNNIWLSGGLRPDSIGIEGSVLFHIPPTGPDPMLLAGFSPSGIMLQSFALPSGGDDPAGLVTDCNGSIYITGDVNGKMILGSDTLNGFGGENMFVAKYNPNLGCSNCKEPIPVLKTNNLSLNSEIFIYPNPASTACTISYSGAMYANATIRIYDITGRLLHTYQLTGSKTTISTADLTLGMYQCRIDVDGVNMVTKKLVVMR
ncbi:MAG: hypothetical protein JWQ38_1618 [Flavipsychrobacter sp.]|nr:hypothetical protein [Flavipsychrobacter sp.]